MPRWRCGIAFEELAQNGARPRRFESTGVPLLYGGAGKARPFALLRSFTVELLLPVAFQHCRGDFRVGGPLAALLSSVGLIFAETAIRN